ncbi:DUF4381 domain-containing protein [Methyloprofundus sp.]|uniref:DUF4381 domain-containing protein n=1 Tax=Methyloprofundus sp. TaxID=2020875 RepID=UPI003D0B1267
MQTTELPLRDIHLPQAISWWPPAIGWWILAVLIPLVIYLCYRVYKHITRKTALKSAKNHLKLLRENQSLSKQEKLVALSSLMRRTAISLYPRTAVASLSGENWLNFLDNSIQNRGFNSDTGWLLTDALYSQNADTQYLAPLINLCETWLNAQKEPKT